MPLRQPEEPPKPRTKSQHLSNWKVCTICETVAHDSWPCTPNTLLGYLAFGPALSPALSLQIKGLSPTVCSQKTQLYAAWWLEQSVPSTLWIWGPQVTGQLARVTVVLALADLCSRLASGVSLSLRDISMPNPHSCDLGAPTQAPQTRIPLGPLTLSLHSRKRCVPGRSLRARVSWCQPQSPRISGEPHNVLPGMAG